MDYYPNRIVCLTEETTELLYILGEEERIVGISAFTKRPSRARKEKPIVSTFLDANVDEILKLKPDLVVGFSDIQANIAQKLIKNGVTVLVYNHRSVAEIFSFMVQFGSLIGKTDAVLGLVNSIKNRIGEIQKEVITYTNKPKVYFEEWYDPLITGIGWVSEIIQICGGIEAFPEKANQSLAKDRILDNFDKVIERNPDIILASWCGKKFKKKRVLERDNWNRIEAVKKDCIYEIDSTIILQPGPAALIDGLEIIHKIIKGWTQLK